MMKPLCKKIYLDKIVEIIILIIGTVFDILFVINIGGRPLFASCHNTIIGNVSIFLNRFYLLDFSA